MIYADTSFPVSLYMLDANTARAVSIARSLQQPLGYSSLHHLEIQNAFSLAIFRGHQSELQAAAAWRNLEADRRAGVLEPITVSWETAFQRAQVITSAETLKLSNRSLDILHVACAEVMQAGAFYTFDLRQHALAQHLGLSVHP
jgi:predicted nucleic acid-binding protein